LRWCRCRHEQNEKYEALCCKEQEVNAYLDGFAQLKHELTTAKASQNAEIAELRHKLATFQGMAEAASPDRQALEEVKSTLEYKQMQAHSAQKTSVRDEPHMLIVMQLRFCALHARCTVQGAMLHRVNDAQVAAFMLPLCDHV
jgi:hypothetical protein